MNIQDARNKVEQLRGQRDSLLADMQAGEKQIITLHQQIVDTEEAHAIIQTVAEQTQRQLEYHISEIVSLALAAVFDSPYTLRVVFVQRRNKTECDILFERDGNQFRPVDATGGGAVDVAALALRFSIWSLRRPRTRNTIILDEPFRFLSRDLQGRAADMLGEISRRMGLQIVMVSHSPDLIEGADRVFNVAIRKGVSYVTCQDAEKDAITSQGYESSGEARRSTAGAESGAGLEDVRKEVAGGNRRRLDKSDSRHPDAKQQTMDVIVASRHEVRTAGRQEDSCRDNGERSRRVAADRSARPRRK